IYTDYKAPGSGNQDDWPNPIDHSEIAGAWKYTGPSQPTVGTYNHDCGDGVVVKPACAATGEQPGIDYSKGTWDWPKPGPLFVVYDFSHPPLFHPGSDTTGSSFYTDPTIPPAAASFVPAPYGTAGTYDGWAWTLNYGYGAAPANDIVYGPDPGPPLALMDETTTALNGIDSTPGTTGTPLSFPSGWLTRGGGALGAQTQTIKEKDSNNAALVTLFGGVNQPSWTVNLHRDVVGNTKDVVNWGLMTYSDASNDPNPSNWCGDIAAEYHLLVPVDSGDTGIVTAIEGFMRLRYFNSLPNPGLAANGGTSTKGAIKQADAALSATWGVDPKKACNRAYGVILCTDGESNTCNTGTPAGSAWGSPCATDTGGTDFVNFPPGAAEAMYLNAHQAGPGDAIIRARTFAIGISSDISRCELNRIAYRGRTDASAKKKDAGFILYDRFDLPVLRGDIRLPWIFPFPEGPGTAVPTDGSGPGLPNGGINKFGPDQTPADTKNYAFFASDAKAL
ncbi:MAG TPA: hypothetical protein VHM68_03750, partial [Candidatus Deferrimicrobium sp.]|nr:hypothetical protein [Candidatus Deferrimicrobium sp.]